MSRVQGQNGVGEIMSSAYVKQSKDYGVDFGDEASRTRQEFKDECDINVLMARYEKSGILPTVGGPPPSFVDWSEASEIDLQAALNILNDAETSFRSLPAKVRAEFDNNAMAFVEFASNPENLDQLRGWGLAKPAEPVQPPMRVEVVNPVANVEAPPAPSKKA